MILKGKSRCTDASELVTSNGARAEWPRHHCVHELFEDQVLRTPDAVAIVCGELQLTYRELNARANQLAHVLQRMTTGMDVPIGICVERSPEMAIGVLAILKAGAAYLPLDPEYPREVLRHMIEHAMAPLVVTQPAVASRIPETRAARVFVDCGAASPDGNLPRRISPGNLACVIYTSGSTGLPRAVAMPHRPLVNLLAWQSRAPDFAGPARTLQFASLSFEISFQEMFSTWCTGGSLTLVSEEVRRDPVRLLKFVDEQRIERMFLPFPVLQQLAEAALSCGVVPRHLHDVTSTGEQLRICPVIVEFFEKLGGCRLHNHYSLSESHVATAFTLSGSPREWPVVPSIGWPIANVQIHLLDTNLKPVPAGEPGEIFISGECLAQGYLYRPTLTAERFIAGAFDHEYSMRLYRTGDIGRKHQDDSIEFLGRLESQVDIRGTRVEPSAVDAFLAQHPGVRECVTVAIRSGGEGTRLCSYVVPRDVRPSAENLRKFLRGSLPKYMIPSRFGFLDALPLTPNGKVDRRGLPAIRESFGSVSSAGAARELKMKSKTKGTRQAYEMAISNVEADPPSDRRPHLGRLTRQRGRVV